jgi:hypothetical protein
VAFGSGIVDVYRRIGSSSISVPRSTHCISSVEANVLVSDAMSYSVSGVAATRESMS